MAKQTNTQIQEQSQQQTQTLSPQQVQIVRMLQLTTVELEERVRAEVLDNPALDETAAADEESLVTGENEYQESESIDSSSTDDYRDEDDVPDYNLWDYKQGQQERLEEIPYSDDVSFYELLKEQLGVQKIAEHQHFLCEYLIGSLDDDGFLNKELSTIADELAIYHNTETNEKELLEALHIIQSFDPAGIGARNLQECLLLQIERKENTPLRALEQEIITKCYDDFTHKHWERIEQKLNGDKATFQEAMCEITKLNPRPGIALGESVSKSRQQIVPDFIVETHNEQVTLSLNRGFVPDLRVSNDYVRLLNEQEKSPLTENKEAIRFLKQKIDSAKNFIDALRQREATLLDTMQAIIDFQRSFFIEGDESKLKPMILKDIANRTHYDISTVSRVSNSKYVQTNWGIFPLKYFFSDGVSMQDGEEISVREIHKQLQDFIEKENKSNPLTDDQLTEMLRKKGYPTARRTVAKYREQLHIPVARLRKNLTI